MSAYDALYPRYRELYAALKPTYDALPGWTRGTPVASSATVRRPPARRVE